MKISEQNLEKFRTWMLERGRTEGTAEQYVKNTRSCGADPKGLTHRLISGELSPNSAHANIAALRAWADFTKDRGLRDRLDDIRLPPARRLKSKEPLSHEQWKQAIKHLETGGARVRLHEPMRQVLLIMAKRGMRSGDVLRTKRADVGRALDTGKLVYEGKGRKRIEISAKPIRKELEVLYSYPGWDRVRDLLGKPTSKPREISNKVRRASRRTAAGIGILQMNPHRYRHTFATRFLDQLRGDPNAIVKLQRYMNWESMNTAARYVDSISQDQLDDVADQLASELEH